MTAQQKTMLLYDSNFPSKEQFPRVALFKFEEAPPKTKISIIVNGIESQYGDPLTNNAYDDDGFRFHDVFHITYMAILGWSPTVRAVMKLKRKSEALVDEIEDGARAVFCEEGVICHLFGLAKMHNFFKSGKIPKAVITNAVAGVSHLEVANTPFFLWEKAILKGFETWLQVFENKGGYVSVNLYKKEIFYLPSLPNV